MATSDNRGPWPVSVVFDDWELRRDINELRKAGRRVQLQEQPLAILDELLRRPGEVVTREELTRRLWPRGVVEFDTSLNTAVHKLRTVLGDHPDRPRYIATIPRKGYRFIGQIDQLTAGVAAPRLDAVYGTEVPPEVPITQIAPVGLWRRGTVILVGVALSAIAAVLLTLSKDGAQTLPQQLGASVQRSTPGTARGGMNPLALDQYLQARARQAEIAPFEPEAPRQLLLDLLDAALSLEPNLIDAYVVRARVHLDFFIANVDVSEERLARVQADLETARRIAGDELTGRDVEALYATYGDLDPARGLQLLDHRALTSDPAVAQARGLILATMGRLSDSNELLEGLLEIDPANQRLLRLVGMNLHAERRFEELLRVRRRLEELSPPSRNLRQFTVALPSDSVEGKPPLSRLLDIAERVSEHGDDGLALVRELEHLRYESRFVDIERVFERITAETVRVGVFGGTLPGLGLRPWAELKAWNALLLDDDDAAARHGAAVQEFVTRQAPTPRNAWFLQLMLAEAYLFQGDTVQAVALAREALRLPPERSQNVYTWAYREFLAATVLAWAEEPDAAVLLFENLAWSVPAIGPAIIARDPLVSSPLQHDERYQRLRRAMEAEIAAYQL